MIVFFSAVIFAFLISFICSILEATLLSLSFADIAEINGKNVKIAGIWRGFKGNIQRPIAVILIVNTIAHTVGATISGSKFTEIFNPAYITFFSVFFSFGMILWTEILPKTLGVRYNKKIAVIIAVPLSVMVKVFNPLVAFFQFLNKPFEGKNTEKENDALQEINILAQFAAFNNQISKKEQQIISKGIKLSEIKVEEIMIKKEEMNCLSSKMSLVEALVEAHIHRHTRFPLIEGDDKNKIEGYINFKDIVSALHINPRNATLKGISRPVMTIYAKDSTVTLLNKLTSYYQHIAIVKNDKNEVIGAVTLEDVIETIVGEIGDEYDVMAEYIHKISDDSYIASGGALVDKIFQVFKIEETKNKTIDEWFREIKKNMVNLEEKIEYKDIRVTVKKIRRNRIAEVLIEKI